MEAELGMFADPIYRRDYPASMKQRISSLPKIIPQLVYPLLTELAPLLRALSPILCDLTTGK